jgi:hypothetical protein
MNYPKYATTVVGAHSVPDWYESLDRLVAVGQLSMASMADAQYRASQAAILDQEIANIDVITGGEMHRRTHNRHSPPNAMLNFFGRKFPRSKARHGQSRSPDTIRTCSIQRPPAGRGFSTASILGLLTSSRWFQR